MLDGCERARRFVTLNRAMNSIKARAFINPKKPRRNGRTVVVGSIADVPAGRGATVTLDDGTELALYNINGDFYAIENFCPHRGAPLAEGSLCAHIVECDWHGWRFDVRTGACLNHINSDLESYSVVIENDLIVITI